MKISAWITEEEAVRLAAVAKQEKRSKSQILQFGLLLYLEQAEKNGHAQP
jgi:hypothetical protein